MKRAVLPLLLLLAGCRHLEPSPEPSAAYVACQDACLLEPGALYQICLQTCRAPRQPASTVK